MKSNKYIKIFVIIISVYMLANKAIAEGHRQVKVLRT
jgi:hypothetical protein